MVAYFVNVTGTFPEVSDRHTYLWTKFPNFNTTHIWWFLWSTLPTNNVVNIQLMTEFGLSVPAQSYYALFNTAPWWLEVTTTTACVALPYNVEQPKCAYGRWCTGALVTVAAEVRQQSLGHVQDVGCLYIVFYSYSKFMYFSVINADCQIYHTPFFFSADAGSVF